MLVGVRREDDQDAESSWARQEEATAQEALRERLIEDDDEELYPSRRWIHRGFVAVSVLTGATAVGMVAGQALGFFFQVGGPIQYFLQFYVVLLSFIVVLNELEFTAFVRESGVLKHWVSRGLLYAFIGLLGLEQMDTLSSRNQDRQGFKASMAFVQGIAWVMACCGILYFAMGACCLHIVLNRLRSDYQERMQRARILREHTDRRGRRRH
jgi:MFS family permease